MDKAEIDKFINNKLVRDQSQINYNTNLKAEEAVDLENLLYSLVFKIEDLQDRIVKLENPDWDIF